MYIKIFSLSIFLLIALSIYCDYHAVFLIREKGNVAISNAIDAGIIKSEYELNDSWGDVKIDENILKQTIKEEIIRSMRLDNNMESRVMKNTSIVVDFHYDPEGVPWVQVKLHTDVSFIFKGIEHPIDLRNTIALQTTYN